MSDLSSDASIATLAGVMLARLQGGFARILNLLLGHAPHSVGALDRDPPLSQPTNARGEDIVDQASEDSFPSSDPPPWTSTGTKIGRDHAFFF
jgi:hypothetical protein